MNQYRLLTESHGGIAQNNLSSILHLDEDVDDETEAYINFKLSEYYDVDSIKSYCIGNKNSINVMSINGQSIFSKIDLLKLQLANLKKLYNFTVHVLCVQECHYNSPSQNIDMLKIENYEMIPKKSTIGQKGGIVIYTHSSITCNELPFFSNTSKLWEGVSVKLSSESLKDSIVLHTVYRPPREKSGLGDVEHGRENHDIFIQEFQPYLQKIKKDNRDTILVGDLNYNLLETSSNSMVQEFFDQMITHELLPQITVPTKINRKSCNLLDHIYTKFNNPKLSTDSCVHIADISDHLPVFISIQCQKKSSRKKFKEVIENSNENMTKVINKVQDLMQETQFEYDLTIDPNINQQKLSHMLETSFKELPTKQVKITKYNTKYSPWITQGLLNSIKKRDSLYKKLVKTKPENPSYEIKKMKLKDHKVLLTKLIRKTKQDYYSSQFKKFSNDCKNTWKLLNQVAGRKAKKTELPSIFKQKIAGPKEESKQNYPLEIIFDTDQSIADEFNKYFANVGPDLSNKIHYRGKKVIEHYLTAQITSKFKFEIASDEDILEAIGTLIPKDSSGYDRLSSKMLIQLSPIIHSPLRLIINQSLITGIFPDQFKIAIITPIYKGKNTDQHSFVNYRPISLLPTLSKIIEKIVHKQLDNYMTKNELFNTSQYGFRKKHSTEFATIEFVDKIAKEIDKKEIPFSIFIDLSKAFDTLDHEILLKKLRYYGIEGTQLKWFESYLTGRRQSVKFNNTISSQLEIKTGVPQGSILGPLLFLIYINDISKVSRLFHAILFADDTSLIGTFTNFQLCAAKTKGDVKRLSTRINTELELIHEWLKINKLSLNVDKTKVMIFHSRQRNMSVFDDLKLELDGIPIKRVKSFNFLGIILNEYLTWTDHISHISQKISPVVALIMRLRNQLPITILKMIYNSLILSRLHYGNILWGENPGSLIQLQKKAVRAVSGAGYNAHSTPLLKKLNLLSLTDIHKIKLLIMYKQFVDETLPLYISNMFVGMDLSSELPKPRTKLYENTIRFQLPYFLSLAPDYLLDQAYRVRYSYFKTKAKEYIIDRYSTLCTSVGCRVCHFHYTR